MAGSQCGGWRRLRLTCLCGLAFALPSCSRPEAAPHERRTPAPVEPAPVPRVEPARALAVDLPELERDRLAYLFEAAELVERRWPQLSAAETCILLVAQTAQWVVNCDEAPASFTRAAGQFRGRPIFAHSGDAFEVAGQMRTTQQLLAQTPAAAHVFGPGAREPTLPPRHPWLLLGTLEALRAFHPAFGPATTESWLSVAMHELVHIHQLRQPGFAPYVERIDAHTLHPAALTALHERDAGFRARIAREYSGLAAAATRALEPGAARQALRIWLGSYRRRSAGLRLRADGAALLHDERLFTYLEGVARFVESDFLVNAAQHPPAGLEHDPQFHRFEAFLGHGYPGTPNRQLDAEYYYAIGFHLCVLLERVDPEWQRRVDTQPGWLIGLIEQLVAQQARQRSTSHA